MAAVICSEVDGLRVPVLSQPATVAGKFDDGPRKGFFFCKKMKLLADNRCAVKSNTRRFNYTLEYISETPKKK